MYEYVVNRNIHEVAKVKLWCNRRPVERLKLNGWLWEHYVCLDRYPNPGGAKLRVNESN